MEHVLSADGSATFYSEKYSEHYHSTTGAVEEALKKFVEPAEVAKRALQRKLRILDICFGVGYNTAAAMEVALASNPTCELEVIGLEIDAEIVKQSLKLDPPFKQYNLIKKLAMSGVGQRSYTFNDGGVHLELLLGDARETILTIKHPVEVVFLDPFSPKKCPELWEPSFIQSLFNVLKPDGVLTTYSCARMVRDNLKNAGFTVTDGPKVGRRGPSTIAIKKL